MILAGKHIVDNVNRISEDVRKSSGNQQIIMDLDHILNHS